MTSFYGSVNGKSCSVDLFEWFYLEIKKKYSKVGINEPCYSGHISKTAHRSGRTVNGQDYPGYGTNFNTIQIEIKKYLREKTKRNQLMANFSNIIKKFTNSCEKFSKLII